MKASIIIATYCPNLARRELIDQSFKELHNTGLPRHEYELIVVSNGGIHETLLYKVEPDLIIFMSRNIGQALAWNAGIAVSSSINLAMMDDDLSYKPGWLVAGLKVLYHHPTHVVSLRPLGKWKKYITGAAGRGHQYARKVGGVWIMRRDLYHRVGRFKSIYDFGGHWTRNLIRSGSRFVVSKTPYIFHMGGRNSMRKLDMKRLADERHRS